MSRSERLSAIANLADELHGLQRRICELENDEPSVANYNEALQIRMRALEVKSAIRNLGACMSAA